MPKDRKLPRGGASQHVRQTELVNPYARLLESRSPHETTRKPSVLKPTVKILGPKARIQEIKEADERLKQHLLSRPFSKANIFLVFNNLYRDLFLGLDASSRQLLEDIQAEAGVPTMSNSYAIEDYGMPTDTYDPDDAWLDAEDDNVAAPETMNIMQAARDLRLQLYVFRFTITPI